MPRMFFRPRVRRTCCVLVLLLVGFVAPPANAGPVASLDTEEVDVGRVSVGETKTVHIVISNKGDEPFELLKILSSCPCARPALSMEVSPVVPPQGSFKVPIEYEPDGRKGGPAGATIAIRTSDPQTPVLIAELVAFIDMPVIVWPNDGVMWSMHARGTPLSKDLVILAGAPGTPIEIRSLEIRDPAVTASSEPVERVREDGTTHGIRITFHVSEDAPLGPMATELVARVVVDGEEMEVASPLRGEIIGDVLVIPPSIISPKTAYKEGDPISQIIVAATLEGAMPRISGAVVEGPLRVEIQPPSTEAPEQRIQVFAGRALTGGPQSGQIHVMTTSLDQPITTIPVYFRAARPLEASPTQVVLGPGGSEVVTVSRAGMGELGKVALEYDKALLDVTVNGGVGGAVTAKIEHIATALEADAATTVTVREPEGAWVSIPVLVRME